jgi:Lrp/AsnC family leucine-responsive transcriptional regulator
MKIDRTDEKLINEMIHNSKISLRELSSKLGVSFVTVMNRLKKLEEEKIIEKYTSKINYEKLGYNVHVLIEIRIAK